MKKYIIILIAFIIYSSTSCDENYSVDPTVLPPITQNGENTFGFLMDSWIYVGGRYCDYSWNEEQSISFLYNRDQNIMYVKVLFSGNDHIHFNINNPQKGDNITYTNTYFNGDQIDNGLVKITRFDKERNIISGTFEGGRITLGRFDVVYEDE